MINKKSEKKDSHEEILRIARERFDLAVDATQEIRREALEDLEFSVGDQWPQDVKNDRAIEQRPCLTINRLPGFIRSITNDQRQNRPAIKISPVDDKADIDTAKIIQGMVRHIENDSNADIAYDTAFDGAVRKGFGYFRIITDFVDDMSFDLEIKIKRVRDAFKVYMDPNAQEPDGSDCKWGFIFEDMPMDDYKAEYKDSELASMNDWNSLGDALNGWITKSTVRVAEYYCVENKSVDIVQLNTGEVYEASEIEQLPPQFQIVNKRKANKTIVKHYKINGVEVLEETEWPGKWIPIIPVIGEEVDVNGRLKLEGVVRYAKDSQRMYNYNASNEAEAIALAPKAPYIAAEGQIPPEYANMWKTANKKTHAYLIYKPTAILGQVLGAPQRQMYEPAVQAITNARMQASEDLKATTGIQDAALGVRSNESSGIAINRRAHQSQTNNFHFVDNLTRALRHGGRIIVDLIPKIYDTPRAARILGEDGEQEIVQLNQLFEHKGKQVHYDLSAGKYDVTIDSGPSFATKRQEASALMMEFSKVIPQQAAMISDLIAKNQDWPGASEIADRLKKLLPPGIADDPNKQDIPPQAKAQMQQMDQMIQQLTEHLKTKTDQIKTKSIELESRERIEMAKIDAQMKLALFAANAKSSQHIMEQEIALIQQRLGQLDFNEPFPGEEQEPQDMGMPAQQGQMPMPQGQTPQQQNQNGQSPDQMMSEQNANPIGGPSPS